MKKILLVDDEKEIRSILKEKLEKNGFFVTAAENGKTALDSIKDNLPDLILLDVVMPVMDGYETCVRLKENDSTNKIPVLFLTCKDLNPEGIIKRYIELGAAGYIFKPTSFSELLEKIKTLV